MVNGVSASCRSRGMRIATTSRKLTLGVRLEGDFESAHSKGDNRNVLPTDTMKKHRLRVGEESIRSKSPRKNSALRLADHFLGA